MALAFFKHLILNIIYSKGNELNMDRYITELIGELHGKNVYLDELFIFIADYSSYFFAVVFLVLVGFMGVKAVSNYSGKDFYGLVILPLALLINLLIRELVSRERPFSALEDFSSLIYHSYENSFPSNHAAASFAIAAMVFLINKRLGYVVFVGALIVSLSRVYVGVHYLSDVMVGALVSILVFYGAYVFRHDLQNLTDKLFRSVLKIKK